MISKLFSGALIASSLSSGISPYWQETSDTGEKLLIDPSSLLNSKQKNLIYSGFPAYSLVELIVKNGDEYITVRAKECAIQYDLWDEDFVDLLRPLSNNKTKLSYERYTDARAYYNTCLSIRLNDSPQVRTLIQSSQIVKVRVAFTQLSGKTTSNITKWLVGQQSKVLKGLFSHMLGELKLSETSEHMVKLPQAESAPKVNEQEKPKDKPARRPT